MYILELRFVVVFVFCSKTSICEFMLGFEKFFQVNTQIHLKFRITIEQYKWTLKYCKKMGNFEVKTLERQVEMKDYMVNFSVHLNTKKEHCDKKYTNMHSFSSKSLSKYTLEHLSPFKKFKYRILCVFYENMQ